MKLKQFENYVYWVSYLTKSGLAFVVCTSHRASQVDFGVVGLAGGSVKPRHTPLQQLWFWQAHILMLDTT